MLRARLSNGAFILGLDAENVRRLQAGQPILVALSQMGGTDDVYIMYGNTVEDIARELEESYDKSLPNPNNLPLPGVH